MEFRAKNTEDHDVQNVKMSIDISGPKRLFDQQIVSFSPRGTEYYEIIKTYTKAGTYKVEGFIDSSGGVNETNERNNKISKNIIVLPNVPKAIKGVTGLKKNVKK